MRTLSSLFIFMAACGGAQSEVAEIAEPESAPVENPCGGAGSWDAVAPLSLPGRVDHSAVWTGTEMLMWGGAQGARRPMADGARYETATNTWHSMSQQHAPVARDDHAAVWTGSEMIVWGGNRYREKIDMLDSGGRYDPIADRWLPTPDSGLTARDDPRAVWTGSEMIVWGGRDQDGHAGDGARYSPKTNRWRAVAASGAPEPREDHTALWTGSEMIVWGGWNGRGNARNYALAGGRYDPKTDTWRPISSEGAPEPREDHSAIWTGREMIVWGGMVRAGSPPERVQVATGGRYDPTTDTWTELERDGAPSAREDGVVVWTGTQMIVWGGQRAGTPLGGGGRYVPSARTWCEIAGDDAPGARRDHAGVWTGRQLVLWGGRDGDGEYPASGAAFMP